MPPFGTTPRRGALTNLIAALSADVAEKQDFPWYASPFISTSPNHYALWAKTVVLGGKVFGNEEWQRLGARVLHRFVTEEQAPDGYWGEWTRNGPTTGYDYLTMAGGALYFHEGPTAPIPQDQPRYHHQVSVPAGIRKSSPWVTCLSGVISTPTTSRWYLDRQGNLSVFHERLGLIITGANSNNQPELATFSEKIGGQVVRTPTSSRLKMADEADQLALAYNSFFAVLEVLPASDRRQEFRFAITPTGRMAEAELNLQLVLKAGEALETATGRKVTLDEKPIRWSAEDVGKWVRHRGWTLLLPSGVRLTWPVYPFNPYRNGPETDLTHAVGTVSFALKGKQTISLAVEANE